MCIYACMYCTFKCKQALKQGIAKACDANDVAKAPLAPEIMFHFTCIPALLW